MKVLRNGEEDVWTDAFSSAAAGAYFGRKGWLTSASIHCSIVVIEVSYMCLISLPSLKFSSSFVVLLPFPEGIQGMLRGALLYGSLIYLTSQKRAAQLQDYTEEPAAVTF